MSERHDATTASRRTLLAAAATGSALGIAGCLGGESDQSGTESRREATETTQLSVPVQGDPNADVRVIVFEDYACPHCRDYTLNVYPQIESEYVEPGDIRYEFHDFPIPVNETVSWEAACAARAVQANEGDAAFFEYNHALFENQQSLGPETYERLANEQGLDGATIRVSAVEREYEPTVQADRQFGREAGVQGTPTVVVGQQAVQPTFEEISAAIDGQLSGGSA